jgi:hypothetical protein
MMKILKHLLNQITRLLVCIINYFGLSILNRITIYLDFYDVLLIFSSRAFIIS